MAYRYTYDDEPKYTPPKLKTDRSMWKLMLLSILTLGLYTIFFFIPFSFDLDKAAPKKDHTKTMNFLVAYVLSILTFSIAMDVWHYQIAARVEAALEERDIQYDFETRDFWVWFILGSLCLVGPFIYYHKLCTAMNMLCEKYNEETAAAR